ncbi:hypothetical protein ACFL3D_02460 [Candidatus Omnitrophota bacterium]
MKYTLFQISESMNRPTVYLAGIQKRFALPVFKGQGYSEAYFTFMKGIVYLLTLNVADDKLKKLWRLEKKIMQLLRLNASDSPTWFLDSCGKTDKRDQRLMLSNCDIGFSLSSESIQLGLDFSDALPELFDSKEMGEDVRRLLNQYIEQSRNVKQIIVNEVPHVRAAARWAGRVLGNNG